MKFNKIHLGRFVILMMFLFLGQVSGSDHFEYSEPWRGSRYVVSIEGTDILLNGEVIKLLGFRTSNALISDATTDDLIANLDEYKAHGLNAVSVYFMGSRFGDVKGYLPDSTLDPVYSARMARIIEAADARGMIVLVGCLYWGTNAEISDLDGVWGGNDANVAVANTVRWLSENNYRNVIVDPDNEGMSPFSVQSMTIAAHDVDSSIMIAHNDKNSYDRFSDLQVHHAKKRDGKPWLDTEYTPGGNSYWRNAKETHDDNSSYRNYSSIGRYSESRKETTFQDTRNAMENHNGIMLASTWLQCVPNEGVGGPFASLGGYSVNVDDVEDVDELHPDAGVRWWAEFVRDEYGAWEPPAPLPLPTEETVLSIDGNRFRINGELVDLYGIRVASALGEDYTDHLIDQLDDYKAHGVNAVTVFYLGSSGGAYDPFTPDGNGWRYPDYRDRMDKIIEACDSRGMVVVAGIFYQWKKEELTDQSLDSWESSQNAVRTVATHLKDKGYKNVILNIANEQNSSGYDDEVFSRVRNIDDLLGMVDIAKEAHPGLIVGCGGYKQVDNVVFGNASNVDVLLFNTSNPETNGNSAGAYDYFVSSGVDDKPVVNVEIFGGWTKKFTPQGVYSSEGKEIHYSEISFAASRPGLSVFFHSNPWCQGPSVGAPVRFDLAGQGTENDPGIHWWFDRVQDTISGGNASPEVSFSTPANGTFLFAPANLGVLVDAFDSDGSVVSVDLAIDGSPVRTEGGAPYEWGTSNVGFDDPLLLGLEKGVYTLTAVATDDGGATSSVTVTVTVINEGENLPPTASISADVIDGSSPLVVNFDAVGSDDIDGDIVDYYWDFGDGTTGSGETVQHVFESPDAGTFGVQLTVTDNDGATDTDQFTISIEPALPLVSFETPSDGAYFPVGTDLYVLVNASDPDGVDFAYLYLDGDRLRRENNADYEWGLESQNDSELRNMAAGTYELRAEATDENGDKGIATISITIGEEPIIESPDVHSAIENGDMIITWERINNENCVLQTTTDLSAGDWTDVVGNPVGVGETMSVTIPVDESKAFFRLKCER